MLFRSVSSTDGFCSFITFEENELGRPYPMDKLPELLPNSFPVEPKAVPIKDNQKRKIQKEDKQKGKDTPSVASVDIPKLPKITKHKEKKDTAKKTSSKPAVTQSEQDKGREATPPRNTNG